MANDNDNKSRKRKQQYRPNNRPVKKKGAYPLRPGVEGFFITSDGGREHQASIEAINIIDNFFDELVTGKVENNGARQQAPPKALNKKIKFNYSDSSESEGEDEDEGGEVKNAAAGEGRSEIGDGVEAKFEDNGAKAEEEKEGGEVKPQSGGGVEAKTEGNDAKVNAESEGKSEIDAEADAKTENNEAKDEEDKPEKEDKDAKTENNDAKVDQDKAEKEEPPAKKQCTGSNGADSGTHAQVQEKSELSIDQQIEAELAQLTDKNKRRFLKLDSGCNGVVFIQMRRKDGEPGPKEITQQMMENAFTTKRHMARHIMRVLPVEVACYSSEEEISRAIKPLIEKYFPVETETPQKYAVLYDARANTGIDRMKIINAVAKSVPIPHKVDLNNPDMSISVQIVKTVCLIGVVENFKKFAKYNLRQLTSSKE